MTDVAPIHDAGGLTRYIETRFHARHRRQLPPLITMAEMIEDLHFSDAGVPEGLSALLRRLVGALEVHMKKEELILFPAIRNGGGPGIEHPIAVMRADHQEHDNGVAEIRRLTGNLELPEHACSTWRTLYSGLEEFIADITEHMRLENEVLFPQFEAGRRPET